MDSLKIDRDLLIPAGRHTLPAEEVSERQRERLLRAMASCASELGYQNTTVADVVRVAKTSRSAFYEHFADKQECFLEVYRRTTATFIGASIEAAAAGEPWWGKLGAGVCRSFGGVGQAPQGARRAADARLLEPPRASFRSRDGISPHKERVALSLSAAIRARRRCHARSCIGRQGGAGEDDGVTPAYSAECDSVGTDARQCCAHP